MEGFPERLQQLMTARSATIQSLADFCRVTRQTASRWYNGKVMPSDSHLLDIAKFLDCDIDDLVEGDQDRIRTQALAQLAALAPRLTDNNLCIVLKLVVTLSDLQDLAGVTLPASQRVTP